MEIKLELLKNHIYDYIDCRIKDFEIDASQIVNTTTKQLRQYSNPFWVRDFTPLHR